MVYLDHNATTRPLPEVVTAMTAAMRDYWGNPSSKHALGQEARAALTTARAEIAGLLGAQPADVVFTSGATEANHHALYGALQRAEAPPRVILSAIEHAGYMKSAQRLQRSGVEVVLLPVDRWGRVLVDALHEALQTDAALISVMAANNETGVLQPIAEIATLARAFAIPFHVDATQMAGKLPVNFGEWGVDLLSVSAHKLHGPKGVGALVMRKALNWPPLIAGQQERARRGGTENVAGIIGFAAAARHARANLDREVPRQTALREALEQGLNHAVAGLTIYGAGAARLPNTVCLGIAGFSADKILNHLERHGIYASSGAACSSGGSNPSHVLQAMGVADGLALAAIRLSLGLDTQVSDIEAVVDALQMLNPQTSTAATWVAAVHAG